MGNKASSIVNSIRKASPKKESNPSYFDIFETAPKECISVKDGCDHLNKIIAAMKYYQSLDLVNNEENRCEMISVFDNIYKSLIDDYIHIIIKHWNEINDIYDIIISQLNISCNFKSCLSAIRHNRDREKHIDGDELFIFYRDLMDSCHCYLCHLFDDALRVNINDMIENNNNNIQQQQAEDPHFDQEFNEILNALKQKKAAFKKLKHFNLNRYKHNKFSLGVDVCEHNEKQMVIHDDDEKNNHQTDNTFLDGLYSYLKDRGCRDYRVSSIKQVLECEEYDSDCIEMDVSFVDKPQNSNIAQLIKNNNNWRFIKQFTRDCTVT